MTKQETFDTVVRHLLTQAKQALDESGDCSYRGNGGLKCAAGCLIPDWSYDPHMEGEKCCDGSMAGDVIERLGHSLNLCLQLQDVHDDGGTLEWPRKLRRVAMLNDLSAAVVDEMEPSFLERIGAEG